MTKIVRLTPLRHPEEPASAGVSKDALFVQLHLHPACSPSSERIVEAWVAREAQALRLHYRVRGAIEDIRWPPIATSGRKNELWRHTCFEGFVRAGRSPEYVEINLSPSEQWAAYRFVGYREGMADLELPSAPDVQVLYMDGWIDLLARIDLGQFSDAAAGAWGLGLSAVIETADGGITYWALAHPAGKPDFHHPDSFVLELPA